MSEQEFFRDKDVARLLAVSHQSIRVQRHFRRYGQSHYLTIDPIMIGSSPRYAREDVEGFIDGLKHPERQACTLDTA